MSALPFPDLGNLDDLDELLEESTRTVTAKTVDDLDDLDQLLTESTELAAAKRAKATGRKLSAEQAALLESNRLAAEAELWITQHQIAHVTVTTCTCGRTWQDFSGWYAYQTQRKGTGRCLLKINRPTDFYPQSQFISRRTSDYCPNCVSDLPVAPADLDLLTALGGN